MPDATTAPTKTQRARYRRPWLAPYQLDALFTEKRYAYVEATTKAGKTAGCLVWLFEQAAQSRPGRSFWWVAPVYAQAEVAYRRMKRAIPRAFYRSNDTERRLELRNGALLWFKSAEKPDNLYGDDVFACVIDEASRVSIESFTAIRSTLTATRGPLRLIGNVKGRQNWFYRNCRLAERGAIVDASYAKITWRDAVAAGILDKAEIDDARRVLSESSFRELYEADAADLVGRVYRDFGPENVRDDIRDLGGDVLIGMDFNVNPMSAVVASRAGDELHVWEEIALANSNTQEMAQEIRSRIPRWQAQADALMEHGKPAPERRVIVYPDPSGNARKTSAVAGQTDFTILRDAGFKVTAEGSAIPVADRINEVNSLACNAEGRRRLFVHATRCPVLLRGLEEHTYKEGTSQPDKAEGIEHAPDALGYMVHSIFPINRRHFSMAESASLTGV